MTEREWLTFEEARAQGVPEEVINQAQLHTDQQVYGYCVTDITGKRIDPTTVRVSLDPAKWQVNGQVRDPRPEADLNDSRGDGAANPHQS